MKKTRSWFEIQSLLEKTRSVFHTCLHDNHNNIISTVDCYMSGLAVFHLKFPSLLQFEEDRLDEPRVRSNLATLYGVKRAPCDTQLRKRLDQESTKPIRYAMKAHLNRLQRTKVLEEMKFLDEYLLISCDATGFYSSNRVKCDHCCSKVHNKGKENEYTSSHHQLLVGSYCTSP